MIGKLVLEDGLTFEGKSFGTEASIAGEVVFSTGMVGYPESLTDPSYLGQILIFTYPLIGSYGIPDKKYWESNGIKVAGLIVSNYIDTPSHFQSKKTLSQWLQDERVPALEIADTRFLTQHIRTKGALLGKIVVNGDVPFYDPNGENLVAKVSTKRIIEEASPLTPERSDGRRGKVKTVLLYDCGAKGNIARCLTKRGLRVLTVPWDYDFKNSKAFDGIVISNGPGDPKMADKTIAVIQKAIQKEIPILGVCLGNQLLALAAGGDTGKLKFGHRSQNQPCILVGPPSRGEAGTKRCYITTQNHGFEVNKIPQGFTPWFINANDGSNEGIIHKKLPFMSVQFHPEATPGPVDTEWIFDFFLKKI